VTAAGPDHGMLVGQGQVFALLDRELRDGPSPAFSIPASDIVVGMRWLGGSEWLVETTRSGDATTSVTLIDAVTGRTFPVRTGATTTHHLHYLPATRTVALGNGEQAELLRHEPGKLRLDRIAVLPKMRGYERTDVFPLDPKLAGGTQAVVIEMRERTKVRWVRDQRAPDKGVTMTVDASPAGVDPSGIVFLWEATTAGPLELAMYRDGKKVGTMPTQGPTAVWPDPDGNQVVQVAQRSISLVKLDGTKRWSRSLQGIAGATFLGDGSIAVSSSSGIARLDASTGEPRAVRCGWQFGLTKKPQPHVQPQEPLCTQLR
jgi:hypothetical protein